MRFCYTLRMDISQLAAAGLNAQQAEAYALLLEHDSIQPKTVAKHMKLTRTNGYKLLDKLVELGLAKKQEKAKKLVYKPTSPLALNNMVYAARTELLDRERAVQSIMDDLLKTYYKHNEKPAVSQASGRDAVIDMFKQQVALKKDVYFIRSLADINSLGFDSMREIRLGPALYKKNRYGITPDGTQDTNWQEDSKISNLKRTWVKQEDYTAPVEWSVSGDMLLIVLFGSEPHAIIIINPVVADAFRQIFNLLETTVRSMEYYKNLPRNS